MQARYRSAQQYRDCVLNPALFYPYRFDVISDEVIAMYREAGVEPGILSAAMKCARRCLRAVRGWLLQPSRPSMNLRTTAVSHAYWAERMAEMMACKGVKIAGWQI